MTLTLEFSDPLFFLVLLDFTLPIFMNCFDNTITLNIEMSGTTILLKPQKKS